MDKEFVIKTNNLNGRDRYLHFDKETCQHGFKEHKEHATKFTYKEAGILLMVLPIVIPKPNYDAERYGFSAPFFKAEAMR